MCSFLDATPTAELIPLGPDNQVQSDEEEMGMSYHELSVFGRLRKVEKCGPYSMFGKLVIEWGSVLSPLEVSLLDGEGLISDCRESETILLLLRHQSAQANHPYT